MERWSGYINTSIKAVFGTGLTNITSWLNVYKGVPMITIPDSNLSSFSFGFMFVEKSSTSNNTTINHEWGHTRQMLLLGIGDYFNMIGVPSMITNLIDRSYTVDYYNMPWEITADMFGGIKRPQHNDTTRTLGVIYLIGAKLVSNSIVKPLLLPLYSNAATLINSVVPGMGTVLLSIMYFS